MFTPPNENLIWAVHRIRTTFVDSIGNRRLGIGTGFWLSSEDGLSTFVTKKHNIDAILKFGATSDMHREQIEIELRQFDGDIATPMTEFFKVSNPDCVHSSPMADCSVLIAPQLEKHDKMQFPIASLTKFKDLASLDDFQTNRIKIMETAIFIGFPGANGCHWWDESWKLPIARECILASWPAISFTNSQIQSEDVLHVSGLSFSGSSGSPVFVFNRGHRPGGDLQDPTWRPARLIGLMSGHFWGEGHIPTMFAHSGLSYLTRSTSIVDILRVASVWQ